MKVKVVLFAGAAMMLPACLVSVASAQSGKVCAVQQYGAKGDGTALDTAAIQKAIDDCAASGGGVVRLAGAAKFVSAPLVLKSHITLEIAEGTTLEGSTNHDDYPEIEQFHSKGRQSLLSATNAEDITIRGGGVIDGRGESWWVNPHQIRPRLIVFDHCKHVLMENVTVENSPMWQIVPYYSDDLTFRNMKILAPTPAGHNTDGIDPFSSGHILIDHVTIDTGDDNVAIKSGQPGSVGPDAPSHDITVRDCVFLKGHGMSVGSEVAGGVQHVHVERVQFKGTTQGIRLKSGRDRGGDLSDFTYKDITMEGVGTAVQITDYYGGDRAGAVTATAAPVTRLTPHFDGIRIENLKVTGAKVALDIEGLPEAPIKNLVLDNVQIESAKAGRIFYAQVQSRGLKVVPQDGQPLMVGTGVTGNLK
ncbi:MAG TPA: glycoside hydrolase family 28 protein [Acidobacteriaceae bacterium]|nr:glycoside hydrolase family 28 protein [Acidobacteriaceae bacterium]